MRDFHLTRQILATADEIFTAVYDSGLMTKYLPTVTSPVPQPRRKRTGLPHEMRTHQKDEVIIFRVNKTRRRVEWSADTSHRLSGWLEIGASEKDQDASLVSVHLTFDTDSERDGKPDESEADFEGRINHLITRMLNLIQKDCEQGSKRLLRSA